MREPEIVWRAGVWIDSDRESSQRLSQRIIVLLYLMKPLPETVRTSMRSGYRRSTC